MHALCCLCVPATVALLFHCHSEVPAPLRHSKGRLEVGRLKQGAVVASGSVGNEGMKHSISVLFMCVTAHTMVCMQGLEGSLLPSLHGHWGQTQASRLGSRHLYRAIVSAVFETCEKACG